MTPEREAEIIREIADQDADRMKEGLRSIFEKGILMFGKPRPLARLRGYLASTLQPDIRLVLDPDYPAKLRAGQAPELLAMQLRQQQLQAITQGADPATVQDPPAFWLRLLELPDYVWSWHSRDFRDVLQSQMTREQASVNPQVNSQVVP